MPTISVWIKVPEGMTADELYELLREAELDVVPPIMTRETVLLNNTPLEDNDFVDLTPDEEDDGVDPA